MHDGIIFAKLGIALICAVFCALLVRSSRVAALPDRRFDQFILLLWGVTRLGLFCAVFVIAGMQVTSDASGVYYPQGLAALAGKTVYRDFKSSYGPAFPYLIGMILRVWHSTRAIVLASALLDGANLVVWLRFGRSTWRAADGRTIAIFYVFSSFALLQAALDGQNQVWAALLLGLAVLFYRPGRTMVSGAIGALPVLLVKFLPLLYLPVFLRWRNQPIRTLAAAVALPAVVFGVLWSRGIDVLQPLRMQGSLVTSGNIPYLVSFWKVLDAGPVDTAYQLLILGIVALFCLYFFSHRAELRGKQIVFGMVVLTLTLALLNKKFFASYLMMVFAPVCAVAALDAEPLGAALRFGGFNILISLEPSLWFRLLHGEENHSRLWQLMPAIRESNSFGKLGIFLCVEIIMIGFYGYYLAKAWGLLRRSLLEEQ